MPKLLLTGITGLIGGNVLHALLNKPVVSSITALVRPGTDRSRYAAFADRIRIVELDLADIPNLKEFLFTNDFDVILHIGALRGGRKATRQDFLLTNLASTEQMVEYAMAKNARLIFCSSVGVFGAIPAEHPANNQTPRNPDNLYHYTKIEAEKVINRAVLAGLQAAIVRPSITYGRGDRGFPWGLVKMVDKRVFPLINKRIWIHLCHIDSLVNAFMWLLEHPWKSGITLTVADREPVQLGALVDFISRELKGRNYPKYMQFDRFFFAMGERIARLLKNELWVSRFELISKSWFYDVSLYHNLMEQAKIKPVFTIPAFKVTIADYRRK